MLESSIRGTRIGGGIGRVERGNNSSIQIKLYQIRTSQKNFVRATVLLQVNMARKSFSKTKINVQLLQHCAKGVF